MVLAVRSSPKTASKVIFVGIFGGRASYIESSDENLEEWSKPIDIQVPQEALDADYWIFWDQMPGLREITTMCILGLTLVTLSINDRGRVLGIKSLH